VFCLGVHVFWELCNYYVSFLHIRIILHKKLRFLRHLLSLSKMCFLQRGKAHTSKNSEPGREQETTSAERHQVNISTKFTCRKLINGTMLVLINIVVARPFPCYASHLMFWLIVNDCGFYKCQTMRPWQLC